MTALIRTGTLTVNPAFLQEIKEVHEDLWNLLMKCRHLAGKPVETLDQARAFLGLLEDLRDKLAMHFSLEEAYGYFQDPIQVAPRIACRCEDLRREHATLYLELLAIADQADALVRTPSALPMFVAIQSAFVSFDDRLRRHEEEEAELIQDAFSRDIGGEG